MCSLFFFFNDTATTEIYTLSLHDALPISPGMPMIFQGQELLEDRWFHDQHPIDWTRERTYAGILALYRDLIRLRSEEHTSELQSRQYLVCRLLLEKKKN